MSLVRPQTPAALSGHCSGLLLHLGFCIFLYANNSLHHFNPLNGTHLLKETGHPGVQLTHCLQVNALFSYFYQF